MELAGPRRRRREPKGASFPRKYRCGTSSDGENKYLMERARCINFYGEGRDPTRDREKYRQGSRNRVACIVNLFENYMLTLGPAGNVAKELRITDE